MSASRQHVSMGRSTAEKAVTEMDHIGLGSLRGGAWRKCIQVLLHGLLCVEKDDKLSSTLTTRNEHKS